MTSPFVCFFLLLLLLLFFCFCFFCKKTPFLYCCKTIEATIMKKVPKKIKWIYVIYIFTVVFCFLDPTASQRKIKMPFFQRGNKVFKKNTFTLKTCKNPAFKEFKRSLTGQHFGARNICCHPIHFPCVLSQNQDPVNTAYLLGVFFYTCNRKL